MPLTHVIAYLCRCTSVEESSCHLLRPRTTDDGVLDQNGYNSTTTSLTFLHHILQDCEYPALIALSHIRLVAPVRTSLHLAVAPPWLTGLLAEQRTLLPHLVHPLGSALVYYVVALQLRHSQAQPLHIPHQRARVGSFAQHSHSYLHTYHLLCSLTAIPFTPKPSQSCRPRVTSPTLRLPPRTSTARLRPRPRSP